MLGQVGLGVGAHEVGLRGLVQAGDQPYGVVEQADDVREGVPEEARDAQRDVDTGAAELGERDRLQSVDPARGVVP